MATRSLLDIFLLMRKNSMQSRHIYSEQNNTSDRMSLVRADVESGLEQRRGESQMPPSWADGLEEAQYTMSRLRTKLKDIEALHKRHLHRPTLDDSSEEETQIEALTQEITRMFSGAHRLVQQIRNRSNGGSAQERRLSYNVVASLVATLQELSTAFRRSQSSYLKKLTSREERSMQYLDTALDSDYRSPLSWEEGDDGMDQLFTTAQHGTTAQQLLQLEHDNTAKVAQREQEVGQIVRSIVDLNSVFKDLAHMVVDQGTVLDRIDYNVEQCQTQVYQGFQQLQKADSYQRKNRKMVCIIVLASTTLLLLLLFVIVKT